MSPASSKFAPVARRRTRSTACLNQLHAGFTLDFWITRLRVGPADLVDVRAARMIALFIHRRPRIAPDFAKCNLRGVERENGAPGDHRYPRIVEFQNRDIGSSAAIFVVRISRFQRLLNRPECSVPRDSCTSP